MRKLSRYTNMMDIYIYRSNRCGEIHEGFNCWLPIWKKIKTVEDRCGQSWNSTYSMRKGVSIKNTSDCSIDTNSVMWLWSMNYTSGARLSIGRSWFHHIKISDNSVHITGVSVQNPTPECQSANSVINYQNESEVSTYYRSDDESYTRTREVYNSSSEPNVSQDERNVGWLGKSSVHPNRKEEV